MDRFALFEDVKSNVEAYRQFLKDSNVENVKEWDDIPIMTKENYLLKYDIEKTTRKDGMKRCSLIGASSGFSKTGSVYWLKQADDEEKYLKAIEESFKALYSIDKKRTLVIVSLAFGMWIGGMQLACAMRSLASKVDYQLTTALPGLDLKEGEQIVKRFKNSFDQFIWITNASNVSIIYSLLKDDKDLLEGCVFFPVVGEYFSESFRKDIALKFGHKSDAVALWTGYGSADTGDLGMETKETIGLRRFLLENSALCRELFDTDDPPMIMKRTSSAFVEIIDGSIVVTKDQLIPLIRYDTKDSGILLEKGEFEGKIPKSLYQGLPDEMICIFGRVSDSVVFYGTNLKIPQIGRFFYSLKELKYSGVFEVEQKKIEGIDTFYFTVYTDGENKDKEKYCKDKLIEFLKSYSREFNAKYDSLTKAADIELINVEIKEISQKQAVKKHKFIKG
ncbi:hypothetical protein [Hippea sp. KM1]|uniref:hypothetical protein n=1 Tax=Hippea sp. KM1 TaxID=944481 RepID=UPI00046D3E8C|nr:hypothetical protein [Hippea sp. KM1]